MPHQKPKVRLWAAAKNLDPVALQEALRAGAPVNAINDQGWTALMWASQAYGDSALEMVTALLAAGADPNLPGHAQPPLSLAVDSSMPLVPILDALLASGADPNGRDSAGDRPLTHLLQRHHKVEGGGGTWVQETRAAGVACARRLIDHGALLTDLNNAGEDALTIAGRHGYVDQDWLIALAVRVEQRALRHALPSTPGETGTESTITMGQGRVRL